MALPAGMKVEVKFVDQDHPRASKWVIFRRIGDCHSACKVSHHRECALFAVRELIDPQLFAVLVHDHA